MLLVLGISLNIAEPHILICSENIALLCHRYSCQHIITSCHYCSDVAVVESLDLSARLGLEFVLHDQQAKEGKVLFDLLSLDGVCVAIGEIRKLSCCQSDNSVALLSVSTHDLLKVMRQRILST